MTIASAAGGGLRIFWTYLRISSLFLLFFIVFLNAAVKSFEERSPLPFLSDVGDKLILSTKDLAEQSNSILTQSNIYDFSSIKNSYHTILSISHFLLAAFVCYTWIRVFGWVWDKTPFSFEGYFFGEMILGFLTFYIMQIIALISYAGIFSQLHGMSDVAFYVILPLQSIYLFFKALFVVLFPVSHRVDKLLKLDEVNFSNLSRIARNGS